MIFFIYRVQQHMMRKTSNLTDDSGRGIQSITHNTTEALRTRVWTSPTWWPPRTTRTTWACPRPGSNASTSGIDTQMRTGSSQYNASPDTTPDSTSTIPPPPKAPSPELRMETELRTKHAPKIIYSHSEDRLTTTQDGGSRPIIRGSRIPRTTPRTDLPGCEGSWWFTKTIPFC